MEKLVYLWIHHKKNANNKHVDDDDDDNKIEIYTLHSGMVWSEFRWQTVYFVKIPQNMGTGYKLPYEEEWAYNAFHYSDAIKKHNAERRENNVCILCI